MKMLFLGKSRRFLISRIFVLVILGSVISICLNGCRTPSSVLNPPPTNTQSAQNTPQNSQTQTSSDNTTTQAAQAVLNQINAARAQAGLPTLQMSTQLINSAHNHNLVMQSANQLSHQLPNEPDLGTRISEVGINWSSVGENIGYSTDYLDPIDVATGLDQDMLNEQPPDDGHRRNILSKDFTTVGIDVFIDTTNHKVWLTEDFAHPVYILTQDLGYVLLHSMIALKLAT